MKGGFVFFVERVLIFGTVKTVPYNAKIAVR